MYNTNILRTDFLPFSFNYKLSSTSHAKPQSLPKSRQNIQSPKAQRPKSPKAQSSLPDYYSTCLIEETDPERRLKAEAPGTQSHSPPHSLDLRQVLMPGTLRKVLGTPSVPLMATLDLRQGPAPRTLRKAPETQPVSPTPTRRLGRGLAPGAPKKALGPQAVSPPNPLGVRPSPAPRAFPPEQAGTWSRTGMARRFAECKVDIPSQAVDA